MVLLWNDGTLDDTRVERLRRSFPLVQVLTGPMEVLQKEKPTLCQEVDLVYAKELSDKQLHLFVNVKWMHCAGHPHLFGQFSAGCEVPSGAPGSSAKAFAIPSSSAAPSGSLSPDRNSVRKGEDGRALTYLNEAAPLLLRKKQDLLITYVVKEPSTAYLDFATTLLFACCQGLLAKEGWNAEKMRPFSRAMLLQIGLGSYGSALVRRAKQAHMRVVGIAQQASFHPFCDKVLEVKQLHSVLPAADVVIATTGRSDEKSVPFGHEELALMKSGSSLFLLGTEQKVDLTALLAALKNQAFSQVWLDRTVDEEMTAQAGSFKQFSRFLHTPGLIDTLSVDADSDFRFFLWNLDCFLHRRYVEMKGLWDRAPARLLERGAREYET